MSWQGYSMGSIFSLRSWLLALVLAAVPASSFAGIFLSINIAPPPLPYYEQPLCPGDGYIWTPGYWADSEDGFFWVPGTWVVAPFVGGLWTPGFWGWGEGLYLWHEGYWGREVGFYGGVNYGYGYGGRGYEGGYWRGDRFNYNRSVNNVNITNIHNVYNKTVINNYNDNRVSYNGGNGGLAARPSREEQAALQRPHTQPLPVQLQHVEAARSNRQQWASVNHGVPAVAATPRPGAFNDRGVVHAAAINRPANANPSGNGTAPLITAHSNNQSAPTNQARPAQPSYNHGQPSYNNGQPSSNNQNGRPAYNAPQSNNNVQPRYNPPPQHQQSIGQEPRYNPPPQHQQSVGQEPRYNPPPQHQQSAPNQPRYDPPARQQERSSAPPQHEQNNPQVRGGEPHAGGEGRPR